MCAGSGLSALRQGQVSDRTQHSSSHCQGSFLSGSSPQLVRGGQVSSRRGNRPQCRALLPRPLCSHLHPSIGSHALTPWVFPTPLCSHLHPSIGSHALTSGVPQAPVCSRSGHPCVRAAILLSGHSLTPSLIPSLTLLSLPPSSVPVPLLVHSSTRGVLPSSLPGLGGAH